MSAALEHGVGDGAAVDSGTSPSRAQAADSTALYSFTRCCTAVRGAARRRPGARSGSRAATGRVRRTLHVNRAVDARSCSGRTSAAGSGCSRRRSRGLLPFAARAARGRVDVRLERRRRASSPPTVLVQASLAPISIVTYCAALRHGLRACAGQRSRRRARDGVVVRRRALRRRRAPAGAGRLRIDATPSCPSTSCSAAQPVRLEHVMDRLRDRVAERRHDCRSRRRRRQQPSRRSRRRRARETKTDAAMKTARTRARPSLMSAWRLLPRRDRRTRRTAAARRARPRLTADSPRASIWRDTLHPCMARDRGTFPATCRTRRRVSAGDVVLA